MFGVFWSLRFCLLLIILRVFFYYLIFQLCVFNLCVFSSVSIVFHCVPQVRLSSLCLCLVVMLCHFLFYFGSALSCMPGVKCYFPVSYLLQLSLPGVFILPKSTFYAHIVSGSPCPLSSCSSWLCVTLFCGSEVILVISCNFFLSSTLHIL